MDIPDTKTRLSIYREALQLFCSASPPIFICTTITKIVGISSISDTSVEQWPEIIKVNPGTLDISGGWWPTYIDNTIIKNTEPRIEALRKCIELCNQELTNP